MMRNLRISMLCVLTMTLLFGSGCATRVRLRVLEPALVTVPADINALAVVDRSQAGNIGQGIVSMLEGVASGEELGADMAGRAKAVSGVVKVLTESPRFVVVQPMLDRKGAEADFFGRELSWATARRICVQARCQGIVALEVFDSDSAVTDEIKVVEEKDDDGNVKKKRVHEVEVHTRVTAGWRLYDTTRMNVIDQLLDDELTDSWRETGDTFDEAFIKLPTQRQTIEELADRMGDDYGRRIAPSYIYVLRKIYTKGDARLKVADDYVKTQNWAQARPLWQEMTQEQDVKLRGKAYFNLALSREVEGDLTGALELAQQAYSELRNRRSAKYVAILQQRIADQAILREQLRKEPPHRESPADSPRRPPPPRGAGPNELPPPPPPPPRGG